MLKGKFKVILLGITLGIVHAENIDCEKLQLEYPYPANRWSYIEMDACKHIVQQAIVDRARKAREEQHISVVRSRNIAKHIAKTGCQTAAECATLDVEVPILAKCQLQKGFREANVEVCEKAEAGR